MEEDYQKQTSRVQQTINHQFILPGKHPAVQLLIRQYHEIPLFGTEYVLSAIRQRC